MSESFLGPKINLTQKVLEDVNAVSRLNLCKDRCHGKPRAVSCFSDPVRAGRTCNPSIPDKGGEKGVGPEVCTIYWICNCYFAARLGIGLGPEEPYSFEKSLVFAKSLNWNDLCEAIDSKVKVMNLDEEYDGDPSEEEDSEDLEDSEEGSDVEEVPPPKKPAVKEKKESKTVVEKVENKEQEPVKKATRRGRTPSRLQAIEMGFKDGSLPFYIARSILDSQGITEEKIVEAILANKWITKNVDKIKETISSVVKEGKFFEKDGLFHLNPST